MHAILLPCFVLPPFAALLREDPPARAKHVIEGGQAQLVDAFKDSKEWIREFLWVETPFDSDGDGRLDRMHVDVTRPKQTDTEGLKVPVVYETSPYFAGTGPDDKSFFWNPDQELGGAPKPRKPMAHVPRGEKPGMIAQSEVRSWLPRGFAVVHSSSPGTGWSDGCPTVGGDNESLAPKAVIDWLCGRAKGWSAAVGGEEVVARWCTGKVGMIGTSYNGTLPLAAATTGVAGLEAIVPIAPNTSYYHYYRSNGLVRHPGGYMGEDVDVLYDFIHSGDPARDEWCDQHVRDERMHAEQHRDTGDWNAFWAERDYLLDLGPMKAACLVSHGFNDWNVMPEHGTRLFKALEKKGLPCIGYWHQGGHGGPPPFELVNEWFTKYLLGADNGVEKGPRAFIVREGDKSSKPTEYADWPNPGAKTVVLHPRGDGSACGELGFAAAKDAAKQAIVDDAAVDGATLAKAEQSSTRLLFATPELAEPVHLSGTARVTITLACDQPATNLSVWLVSLPWTGEKPIYKDVITRGWADPRNRASLEKEAPLVPGKPVTVTFDLEPDDQIVPAGEKIGLMLFASDHDFTLWPKAGTKLEFHLADTLIELPVVGGKSALEKAFRVKGK
ncbi:MAG: Xaa-Pro dipeptidyl-peptidase [Planctomycetes bacterium]|nr:Xaa-Pro dipeptidyl-peptidase [Planctomycetota bacterium]